jgi:hypothetical protein
MPLNGTSFIRSVRSVPALRVVLLVCASWQGPVPYWHAHGPLAGEVGPTFARRVEHLRSRHATDPLRYARAHAWHFHVDFPGPMRDGPNAPRVTEQSRVPATSITDGLASLITDSLRVGYLFVGGCQSRASGLQRYLADDSRGPAHFYDAYAPTLALPLRFCVQHA